MTVRLDRLRAAVIGCISMLAPAGTRAVWGMTAYPRRVEGAPAVVTARLARGPFLRPAEVTQRDEPTRIRWTLADPPAGARIGLSVAGARYFVDTLLADTVEEGRDRFLARMTVDQPRALLPGTTITASGTDSIVFDSSGAPGLLYGPRVIGGALVVADVEAVAVAESARAAATVVVELQAFAAGGGVEADEIIAEINGGLGFDDALALRHNLGVSLQAPDEPVSLTSLAGPDWESRSSTRWSMSLYSYKSRPIATIEEVLSGFVAYNGSTAISIPVEVEI